MAKKKLYIFVVAKYYIVHTAHFTLFRAIKNISPISQEKEWGTEDTSPAEGHGEDDTSILMTTDVSTDEAGSSR